MRPALRALWRDGRRPHSALDGTRNLHFQQPPAHRLMFRHRRDIEAPPIGQRFVSNPDIGMMVLSSPGPDEHGQWTAQPATARGYGDYAAGPSHVPADYGRYLVLSAAVSLDSVMKAGKPVLNGQIGHSEPSAFVDDVRSGDGDDESPSPYVYVVTHFLSDDGLAPLLPPSNGRKDDLAVARARLDRGGAPLTFSKWDGASFPAAGDGRGGADGPMLPNASDGNFTACGDNASNQGRSQGSISWVDETRQYLLVFVCTSPGDPALGARTTGETGSAWFFATADTLSDQSGWSIPTEIEGSYTRHVESGRASDVETSGNDCALFNGWYPDLMSVGKHPGHLSIHGYVFYLIGSLGACTDDDGDSDDGLAPRTYASRQFTIVTAPR